MTPAPIIGAGELAAALDAFLGDPDDPHGRLPDTVTRQRDRASELPVEAIRALDEWGMPQHYIPQAWGGALGDLLTPLLLMRTVARRDVTAAVGHGKTVLGAICAWAAADGSAAHMAAIVGAGDPVSWGLTEQGRGSDIASSTTTAVVTGSGIRVDGHKWPIGNATRGRAVTVLARTDDRPGPRSLSLVLVDKTEVERSSLTYRARRPLHGIRGADISGIDFAGTVVPEGRLIGDPGQGIELVLKSLQVTRTLCAALSLGAGDQALEAVASAATAAPGDADTDRLLAESVADLLLAEAIAFAGTRMFHGAVSEMALVSAFVKVLVPDLVDGVFREAGEALGPSTRIADGPAGRFEKAARDSRVVGIFDGNSVVNLNVVINEFPNIARGDDEPATALADFSFGVTPASFDMSGLRLVTRRGTWLLRALPDLVAQLDDGRTHPDAVKSAARIAAEWRVLRAEVRDVERAARPPASQFILAERVTFAFAAAAAIAVHLANRDAVAAPAWTDDLWLRASLDRIAMRLGIASGDLPARALGDLARTGSASPVSILPLWWTEQR